MRKDDSILGLILDMSKHPNSVSLFISSAIFSLGLIPDMSKHPNSVSLFISSAIFLEKWVDSFIVIMVIYFDSNCFVFCGGTLDIVAFTKNISIVADEIPESIKLRLYASELDSLLNLVVPTYHLSASLAIVVNYYDNESECFVVGEEKLFIGLKNVLRIIDLPIDGKPVITREIEEEQLCFVR